MDELTDEQKRELQSKQLARFQSMNIPTARVNQSAPQVLTVKNPAALKKLDDIKRGAFKSTFTEIVKKPNMGDNKLGLNYEESAPPALKQQAPTQQTIKAPALFEEKPASSRELDEASMLFADSGPSQARPMMANPNQQMHYAPGQRVNEMPMDFNDDGSSFVQETRNKFHSNMQQKIRNQQQQQYYQPQQAAVDQYYQPPVVQPAIPYTQPIAPTVVMPQLQQGLVVFNEEDLKKKIISYATQIAKKVSEQMIKSVLNEYLGQKKTPIVETENVKKAEIVGENVVKIDGQIFKLVPAQVKSPAKKVSE